MCLWGAGMGEQIADLKRGCDVLVCTPGRLIDVLYLQSSKIINLKHVTMVVIDEADRMFELGFETQVRSIGIMGFYSTFSILFF